MSNRVYIGCAVVLLLLVNSYPLYQMVHTGGYLFYQNAFDEPGYLNYEMAREYVSLSRVTQVGERLVLLGHHSGISAGWINFLLDLASLTAFLFFSRLAFKSGGFRLEHANAFSLLAATLPMVFLLQTQTGSELLDRYLASPFLAWIAAPSQTNFLPIVRTPEPQVSLAVLSLAVWLALKFKSYLPAYACLPLLYPFVAIPFLFVLVALHIRSRFEWMARHWAVSAALSFGFVSSMLAVYFAFFTGPPVREAMMNRHAPLVSATGALSLAALGGLYSRIRSEHRFVATVVALTPFAGVNQQVISGWVAQPYNFELYSGLTCLVLVVVLGLGSGWRLSSGLVAISMAAVAYSQVNPNGAFQFRFNVQTNRPLRVENGLLEALRTQSGDVAIADPNLASAASMIFPKQTATGLAYQRTIGTSLTGRNFASYLCLRRALLSSSCAEEFRPALSVLDHAYKYEGMDYNLLHLGQKKTFEVKNDPAQLPAKCPQTLYWLVLHNGSVRQLDCTPEGICTSDAKVKPRQ